MSHKTYVVSIERWNEAIGFLGGKGSATPSLLTATDRQKLANCLRGPFAGGMQRADAARVLRDAMRWRVYDEEGKPASGQPGPRLLEKLFEKKGR
jgi:hypothetical protein